jgi:uracil-DNA glycosylase
VTHDDPRAELAELTAALRAHAEWQQSTGAHGLPAATRELAQSRAPELATAPAVEPARAPAPASAPSPAPAPAPAAAPAAEPLAVEERVRRLELLAEEVKGCTACRLHETRTQTVFARGTLRSGLCFVGEGPGADEDAQGFPFVGKAGQLLDRMIAAMGFEPDDVLVMNAIKCRPPDNRKPEPDELAACRGFFERQLELAAPSVMVALGATAVQALLGTTAGITRLRGSWKLYRGRIAVMPTFHPAYLLRNPAAKREVWSDLQQVLRHMGRPVPPARKG